jgi:RHS repeat-associated protein
VAGLPETTSYNGLLVQNLHDNLGRVVSVSSTNAATNVSQTFVFDTATGGLGKLASTSDGSVTTAYTYDSATGRLTGLTTTAAGQTFTQTFAYGDGYGNRTAGNTSHGAWTQTYHLAAGLPNLLSYGSAPITSIPWVNYDTTSWMPKELDYGNGVCSKFKYDHDQTRLIDLDHLGVGGTVLEHWAYQYDGIGNLNQVNDLVANKQDSFQYDLLNRLTGAAVQSTTYGEQDQNFAYDAFGNRINGTTISKGTVAPTTANLALNPSDAALWQHNQIPSQMTNDGVTSSGAFTGALYDAQGNLTQIYDQGDKSKVITMNYDALGRVIRVTHNQKGLREDYQYRADGLRTVADVYLNGVFQKTRIQIYNDARQLVSQYEKSAAGSLTWKKDILYVGTREAAELDAAGMHVTQIDHQGSPRVVTGPTGLVEGRQKYLPFGELLDQIGGKTAKGYTGHEQTDDSGLIYMQARFYVPWYGRFTSPDPGRDQHFEQTQSWNIYSYVQNNPVNSVDPTGMDGEMAQPETTPEKNGNGTGATPNMSATLTGSWESQPIEVVASPSDSKGSSGLPIFQLYNPGNLSDPIAAYNALPADHGEPTVIPGTSNKGASGFTTEQDAKNEFDRQFKDPSSPYAAQQATREFLAVGYKDASGNYGISPMLQGPAAALDANGKLTSRLGGGFPTSLNALIPAGATPVFLAHTHPTFFGQIMGGAGVSRKLITSSSPSPADRTALGAYGKPLSGYLTTINGSGTNF